MKNCNNESKWKINKSRKKKRNDEIEKKNTHRYSKLKMLLVKYCGCCCFYFSCFDSISVPSLTLQKLNDFFLSFIFAILLYISLKYYNLCFQIVVC